MDYIGKILSLCKSIVWLVTEVKGNKKRCRHLAERVKAMEELVQTIRQRGPRQITPNVNRALGMLTATLATAHELVHKCTKTKFLNLVKCRSKFNSVNESLRDIFQILSGALQVETGNMMHKMFQDFALEDDDDDYGALTPYGGAMSPAFYSPAPVAPVSYFPPPVRAPPPPVTAVYAAAIEMAGDSLRYTEALLLMQ